MLSNIKKKNKTYIQFCLVFTSEHRSLFSVVSKRLVSVFPCSVLVFLISHHECKTDLFSPYVEKAKNMIKKKNHYFFFQFYILAITSYITALLLH